MKRQLKKNEKVQIGLLSLACVIIVLGILFLVNAMQEDPADGFFPRHSASWTTFSPNTLSSY